MKPDELDDLLRDVPPPERPESYWSSFPGRVLGELIAGPDRAAERNPSQTAPPRAWRLTAWAALAGAAACLLLSGLVRHLNPPDRTERLSFTAGAEIARELSQLFPRTLEAVVTDTAGASVVLTDERTLGGDQPVMVRLGRGGDLVTILTFSGRRVRAGGLTFEVLADGTGNVLLIGDAFVWSSADPMRVIEGSQVEAQGLPMIL